MKEKHLDEIERFISNFDGLVKDLEHFSSFLQMNKETENLREEAFSILHKKVKKMKKSEDMDDLKKVLRVKKILEKRGKR